MVILVYTLFLWNGLVFNVAVPALAKLYSFHAHQTSGPSGFVVSAFEIC